MCTGPDAIEPAAITKELSLDIAFAYRAAEFAETLRFLASDGVGLDVEQAFARLRAPDGRVKVLVSATSLPRPHIAKCQSESDWQYLVVRLTL